MPTIEEYREAVARRQADDLARLGRYLWTHYPAEWAAVVGSGDSSVDLAIKLLDASRA